MRRYIVLLLLSVAPVGLLFSLDVPIPPNWSVSSEALVQLYGEPDVTFGGLLSYRQELGGESTDMTLWLTSDRLSEVTYAFDLADHSDTALRAQYTRIAKYLRALYGMPDSTVRIRYSYRTDIWSIGDSEVTHGVVYTSGREQHFLYVRPVLTEAR
jgi:hypothetical protein